MAKKKNKNFSLAKVSNKMFFIAFLVLIILGLAIRYFALPALEKYKYEKLDGQSYTFIQKIAEKYPGKITHEKSCRYSSAKFSKGELSCLIEYGFFSGTKQIEINQNTHPQWGEGMDNTRNAQIGSKSLKKSYLFTVYGKDCSITQYQEVNNNRIYIHCSGSALKEHYPVKN